MLVTGTNSSWYHGADIWNQIGLVHKLLVAKWAILDGAISVNAARNSVNDVLLTIYGVSWGGPYEVC